MGFLAPAPPPVDVKDWKTKSHLARIKPLAQDWAVNGFGTPTAIYLLYVVKLVVFSVGGFLLISATTSGLGGLGNIGDWWTEPIVFQKIVVWLLLWEVLGLGCGSMPLTFRFLPPIGGILYWLRPGTVRRLYIIGSDISVNARDAGDRVVDGWPACGRARLRGLSPSSGTDGV